jgi:hypothetical protein
MANEIDVAGTITHRSNHTYAAGCTVTLTGGVNVVLDTTGSKIATAATQKLGFWGVAAVVQPATTGTATGYTGAGGTALTHTDTFTGNTGTKAYTIGDIVLALKQAGIMAAS